MANERLGQFNFIEYRIAHMVNGKLFYVISSEFDENY